MKFKFKLFKGQLKQPSNSYLSFNVTGANKGIGSGRDAIEICCDDRFLLESESLFVIFKSYKWKLFGKVQESSCSSFRLGEMSQEGRVAAGTGSGLQRPDNEDDTNASKEPRKYWLSLDFFASPPDLIRLIINRILRDAAAAKT